MLGREALKATYPELWADAVQQVKDANPGLTDESFEYGRPCYEAEDIMEEALAPQGVDVSYAAMEDLGKEYAKTAYADELAQAEAMAQAEIDELKSLRSVARYFSKC